MLGERSNRSINGLALVDAGKAVFDRVLGGDLAVGPVEHRVRSTASSSFQNRWTVTRKMPLGRQGRSCCRRCRGDPLLEAKSVRPILAESGRRIRRTTDPHRDNARRHATHESQPGDYVDEHLDSTMQFISAMFTRPSTSTYRGNACCHRLAGCPDATHAIDPIPKHHLSAIGSIWISESTPSNSLLDDLGCQADQGIVLAGTWCPPRHRPSGRRSHRSTRSRVTPKPRPLRHPSSRRCRP